MYQNRLKDCFVILGLAHSTIEDSTIREQLRQVAIRYKGIVNSNKKLTKKRVEKLEDYLDNLSTFNEKKIIQHGEELLKKI